MTQLSPKEKRRNVVALGFVSMFNDIASEMAYPIIPIFLTAVLGAPVVVVGMIEGIVEAVANILKVFSGWLSDRLRRRKRFVAAGYTLSAFAKILLAAAGSWGMVLGARFIDRFGKGVRTSARDALIADSSDEKTRGAAFGLHRAMDTLGAVIGPLLAIFLLHATADNFSRVFLIAAVPALIGVLILIAIVREPGRSAAAPRPLPLKEIRLTAFGPEYRSFLLASGLFAIGNSSDVFLILRAKDLGFSTEMTVALYVVFNACYSLLSYPLGRLSDRWGARRVLTASFFLFAGVYAGFGMAAAAGLLWFLFPAYGLYMAMSEGVSKAYVSGLVAPEVRATAIGLFYTVTGIGSLAASLIAGAIWSFAGIGPAFYYGAVLAAAAGGLFLLKK